MDWNPEFRNELKTEILSRFKENFPKVPDTCIEDIIVSGSRVYYFNDRKDFFTEDSDLDCGIILEKKCFKEFFLPVNELSASRMFIHNLLQLKKHKNKYRPKMQGFEFYKIRVSVFIFPQNGKQFKNTVFMDKELPYYSLFRNIYVPGNPYDLLEYLTFVKPRLEPYTYCFLCNQKLTSEKNIVEVNSVSILNDGLRKHQVMYAIVCEKCKQKLKKKILKSFKNAK